MFGFFATISPPAQARFRNETKRELKTHIRYMVRPTAAPTRAALNAEEMTVPVMPFLRFEGGTSSTTTTISTRIHVDNVKGKKENKIIAKDNSSNIGRVCVVVVGAQVCAGLDGQHQITRVDGQIVVRRSDASV